jgi:energy-coupling factor transporter ATP-binding protein EcfA2
MTPTIEAHGLRKRYGKTTALDGLDLLAESGQVVAVLGPNGADKTTFVRAVATLLALDEGILRVCGARRALPSGRGAADDRPGGPVCRGRARDDRTREPRDGRRPVRAKPPRRKGQRRRRARSAWAGRRPTVSRGRIPAACAGGLTLARAWWGLPACCCSTSRPPGWTRVAEASCGKRSEGWSRPVPTCC